jgi:hypothetical protein
MLAQNPNSTKPTYKIEKVKDFIYCVQMPDRYDRAMTFCRAQEFYESPNDNFRGKPFSIWEYIKWYSLENKKGFSYGMDWSGFNIPLKEICRCYELLELTYGKKDHTIYDHTLLEILEKVKQDLKGPTKLLNTTYIIGTDGKINDTFKHEICHGLYSTNTKYRSKANSLIKTLKTKNPKVYNTLKANICEMGYSELIAEDEIQAYLQFGFDEHQFGKNVDLKERRLLNKEYKEKLYDAFEKN